MNEHKYVRAVHRQLKKFTDPSVKIWKINDNFQGGVPDAHYMGARGKHIWVEYKWVNLPKRQTTIIKGKHFKETQNSTDLSPLQIEWLSEAYERGQDVFVVVGSDCGALMLDGHTLFREDVQQYTRMYFDAFAWSTKEVAERIYGQVVQTQSDE